MTYDTIVGPMDELTSSGETRRSFEVIVTAWKSGKHNRTGGGYGLKVAAPDRDRYFERCWSDVAIQLGDGGDVAIARINGKSFWNDTCRELRSQKIGKWLLREEIAPWPHGCPPKLELEPLNENLFKVYRIS
jgi:hypothetical protein